MPFLFRNGVPQSCQISFDGACRPYVILYRLIIKSTKKEAKSTLTLIFYVFFPVDKLSMACVYFDLFLEEKRHRFVGFDFSRIRTRICRGLIYDSSLRKVVIYILGSRVYIRLTLERIVSKIPSTCVCPDNRVMRFRPLWSGFKLS